jgi:holin-like protein
MKRPFIVTIISIVMFLAGLFQLLIGAVVLANRNDDQFLSDAEATSSEVTTLGIVLLVVGVVSVLVAIGLWGGSKFARALAALSALGQVATGVYTLVQLDSSHRASGIGMIAGSLIVLYLLFGTDKAKRFFA